MSIKLLVMDVDGTLTDGCIYIGAEGEVMKAFDVRAKELTSQTYNKVSAINRQS